MGVASRVRTLATLVAIALVVMACGTRVDPQVYEQALLAEGTAAPGPTTSLPQAAGRADDAEIGAVATGPNGDPAEAPASGGGAAAAATTDDDAGPSGAPQPTETGDQRTAGTAGLPALSDEVVGDVITIGMHVPETGAAPLPTDWEDVLRIVLEHINREMPVHGRTVELVVEDDGYDPAVGRAACRRLLAAEPLLVIGHTMPAAQDACAGLFNDHGIPYLMRGTTPVVLEDRPLAFFGTAPDDVQGRLLAEYVLREYGAANRPVGVLYQDDQLAARDAFVARIERAGGTVAVVEQGTPRQSDYGATIQNFRRAGVELVFLSTPPVDAIQIAVQANGEGYRPTWLGGGTYWNYNLTLEAAGMAMDGAVSLSPWPTIDAPAAAEFRRVYQAARPDREPEDIGLIMWGWTNLLREVLHQAGPDISRQSVLETLQTFEFAPPYWNPVSYAEHGQVGASQVMVHRADGQARRWRQVTGYTGGF